MPSSQRSGGCRPALCRRWLPRAGVTNWGSGPPSPQAPHPGQQGEETGGRTPPFLTARIAAPRAVPLSACPPTSLPAWGSQQACATPPLLPELQGKVPFFFEPASTFAFCSPPQQHPPSLSCHPSPTRLVFLAWEQVACHTHLHLAGWNFAGGGAWLACRGVGKGALGKGGGEPPQEGEGNPLLPPLPESRFTPKPVCVCLCVCGIPNFGASDARVTWKRHSGSPQCGRASRGHQQGAAPSRDSAHAQEPRGQTSYAPRVVVCCGPLAGQRNCLCFCPT